MSITTPTTTSASPPRPSRTGTAPGWTGEPARSARLAGVLCDRAEPDRAASPPVPVAVRPADDAAGAAAWAAYAGRCPQATVFHEPEWSAAVVRAFGHRPQHRLAQRGGQVVGVLPLIEVDSLLAGRLLISVPCGNYGGILADDEAAAAALAAEAVRLAGQRGARMLELRSAEARVPGLAPVAGYLGFVRELPGDPAALEMFLPRKARAAMRHARARAGVAVVHDAGLARAAWELYCRSMRRLGSLNYPYRLFAELRARLGERAWVSAVLLDGRPVAATISLVFRDTVMPYVVGVDERVPCEGATNLLYFAVMERAVRCGLRRFDFGRSRADNAGAVSFKKHQGFTPRPLGYQRYVPAGRRAPDLRPSSPRFAAARRVWTRLPLPLTRALGAWLARSLPG